MTDYILNFVAPIAPRRSHRDKRKWSSFTANVISGVYDFKVDNTHITKHALERCKERNIPLEDLHRLNPKVGTPVMKGNTIVTILPKKSKKKYHKFKKTKISRKKCNRIIVED